MGTRKQVTMTDNFKMCLELTEELEKHKKQINQYKQKLKAKEQECEELKAKCKKYGEINEQETKDYAELKAERDSYIDKYFLESQKVLKLNKVLKEIKEIAENVIKNVSYRCIETTPIYYIHKQILQKISECEGNDETNN